MTATILKTDIRMLLKVMPLYYEAHSYRFQCTYRNCYMRLNKMCWLNKNLLYFSVFISIFICLTQFRKQLSLSDVLYGNIVLMLQFSSSSNKYDRPHWVFIKILAHFDWSCHNKTNIARLVRFIWSLFGKLVSLWLGSVTICALYYKRPTSCSI